MQDVNAVLSEKENAIKQLRKEIEALRLVCPLLVEEDDATTNSYESGIEMVEVMPSLLPAADQRKQSLEGIRERLLEAGHEEHRGGNVLVQFKKLAVDASRTILKHVRDSRSEIEPRWRTFRGLFDRPERSNAA